MKHSMNPFCEIAMEEAVRLKEKKVTICNLGRHAYASITIQSRVMTRKQLTGYSVSLRENGLVPRVNEVEMTWYRVIFRLTA